jgi:hypothetical protein
LFQTGDYSQDIRTLILCRTVVRDLYISHAPDIRYDSYFKRRWYHDEGFENS